MDQFSLLGWKTNVCELKGGEQNLHDRLVEITVVVEELQVDLEELI